MPTDLKVVQVYLDDEKHAKLKAEAAKEGRSVSNLGRKIFEDWLRDRG